MTAGRLIHQPPSDDGVLPCCGVSTRRLASLRPRDQVIVPGKGAPAPTCRGQWRRRDGSG